MIPIKGPLYLWGWGFLTVMWGLFAFADILTHSPDHYWLGMTIGSAIGFIHGLLAGEEIIKKKINNHLNHKYGTTEQKRHHPDL